jgi:hypothetical protein
MSGFSNSLYVAGEGSELVSLTHLRAAGMNIEVNGMLGIYLLMTPYLIRCFFIEKI